MKKKNGPQESFGFNYERRRMPTEVEPTRVSTTQVVSASSDIDSRRLRSGGIRPDNDGHVHTLVRGFVFRVVRVGRAIRDLVSAKTYADNDADHIKNNVSRGRIKKTYGVACARGNAETENKYENQKQKEKK